MKILIAGALAVGLLVLGTPLAHADANQAAFVHQVQAMGDPGTSDEILGNGYTMCHTLRTTDLDIHAVAVQAAPQIGVWVGLAAGEVGAAIRWLCPDQIGQFARSTG